MRINQYISHNTGHSRREADELIKAGKVRVNGRVLENLGYDVRKNDKVSINSRAVRVKNDYSVIVYHKPKGELVSKSDARGRRLIYDSLPNGFKHFIPVGRLDYASSGLLLLTDAPKIATALSGSDLEREYYLKVKGSVSDEVKEAMRTGLSLKDATKGAHAKTRIKSMDFAPFVAFGIVSQSGGYTRLRVIINEGKNRELRRFFGHFDLEVMDLKRVAFGAVSLDTLKEGKWRYFGAGEYDRLRDFLTNLEPKKSIKALNKTENLPKNPKPNEPKNAQKTKPKSAQKISRSAKNENSINSNSNPAFSKKATNFKKHSSKPK